MEKGTPSCIHRVLLESSLVSQCPLWGGHPGTDSLVGTGMGLRESQIPICKMCSIQDDFQLAEHLPTQGSLFIISPLGLGTSEQQDSS